jgi:hypothetical protein
MVYVVGYVGLRCVWLVLDKLVSKHREEGIAEENRNTLVYVGVA